MLFVEDMFRQLIYRSSNGQVLKAHECLTDSRIYRNNSRNHFLLTIDSRTSKYCPVKRGLSFCLLIRDDLVDRPWNKYSIFIAMTCRYAPQISLYSGTDTLLVEPQLY